MLVPEPSVEDTISAKADHVIVGLNQRKTLTITGPIAQSSKDWTEGLHSALKEIFGLAKIKFDLHRALLAQQNKLSEAISHSVALNTTFNWNLWIAEPKAQKEKSAAVLAHFSSLCDQIR